MYSQDIVDGLRKEIETLKNEKKLQQDTISALGSDNEKLKERFLAWSELSVPTARSVANLAPDMTRDVWANVAALVDPIIVYSCCFFVVVVVVPRKCIRA